jgi:hypothetical protein
VINSSTNADRRTFLGPWRTTLADLPVLTLFGCENDPYGCQGRFAQIFPYATAAGIADWHHFPVQRRPGAEKVAAANGIRKPLKEPVR